ncbi:MAG TPA: Mut7-C RNAse domain-containing protein [Candidatus Udaeobacter sp.]|nr:Mut7-C RNAse domain-containing protein [Candidatus Udaeobacter sp.]
MSKAKATGERPAHELKFAADRMLGRLVKWLRIMGQDVIYGEHLSGYGLIRAARLEHRLILTRDRGIAKKQPPNFLFIESDHYREQLRQVIQSCGLAPSARALARCLKCNSVLRPRPKELVEGIVPPYVFSTQERFSWCPECRRVYWPATHHQRMMEELKQLG